MFWKIAETLDLSQILSEIEPQCPYGRNFKKHVLNSRPGTIHSLRQEYLLLDRFIDKFKKSRQVLTEILEILAHIPEIRLSPDPETVYQSHELFEIKLFLYYYRKLKTLLMSRKISPALPLIPLESLFHLLDPEGQNLPYFALSPAYSKGLASYQSKLKLHISRLMQSEQVALAQAQSALGIPTLKKEFTLSKLQAELHDKILSSKYFILKDTRSIHSAFQLRETPALLKEKQRINALRIRLQGEEDKVLKALSASVFANLTRLKQAISSISRLDWDLARCAFAIKYECISPLLHSKDQIFIQQAKNLSFLNHKVQNFQALDFELTHRINLLTGPNMGGKTTALKTLGQFCFLAGYAIPLPCQVAILPVFDFVWYNQLLPEQEDLSSFGSECVGLNHVLNQKGKGLILLDEFGKSTNPTEGEALTRPT